MGELLKASDVARLLNVSGSTVRRWIEEGHLTSIRTPGGQHRITREAAEALMQAPPESKAPAAA